MPLHAGEKLGPYEILAPIGKGGMGRRVFSLDPRAATKILAAKVALLNADEQAALVDCFLSASFGDSISGVVFKTAEVPGEALDELVRLTFQTHSPVPGRRRLAGVVYKMNENDYPREREEFLLRLEASRRMPIPIDHRVGERVDGLDAGFVLRVIGSRLGVPCHLQVLTLGSPPATTVALAAV